MRVTRKTKPRFTVRPLALALAGGSLLSLLPGLSPAQTQPVLPSGLTVIQGQVKAVTNGKQLTVTNSANSILNWQSFSIGAGNGVSFVQPSAQSQVLNRVVGNDPSSILGSLSSNGKVWLLNPNGVIFGQGARIDVAGLVTSTLNLNDIDWLGGRYLFSASGTPAGIVNQGELRSSFGGHIALLGGSVRNEGLIDAPGGQVLLAAGKSIELIDTGSPNLRLKVTAPAGEALNLGTLAAAGGRIDVHGAMVNQQGIVRADSLGTNAAGEIVLSANQSLTLAAGSTTSASGTNGGQVTLDSGAAGTTLVSGNVTATGSAGTGGQLTLLGKNVGVVDAAKLDASGTLGGGQIHVGGGERGQDPAFRNADAVYIGQGASLAADATGRGNGGRIILWGNEATRAYGSFTARGGPNGGNGGFIETSGGWIDVVPAKIDAAATFGTAGTWLLDPYDIAIVAYGGNLNVGSGPTFTSSGTPAQVTSSAIITALNAGSNVVVATGSGGTEAGNISANGIDLTSAPTSPVSLSLQAHGGINLFGTTIASTAAPLSVSLQAGLGGSGDIGFDVGTVSTAGGSFSATSVGGTSFFGTSVNTAGGSFSATSVGSTSFFGSSVTTAGGNVTLSGNLAGSGNAAVSLTDTPINAGGGTVTMNGTVTNGVSDGESIVYPTGVRIDGGDVSARDITIVGSASSADTGQARGVEIIGSDLTAVHRITITGTGEVYGVAMDLATASVRPATSDPSATLTITGTSTANAARPASQNYGVFIQGLSEIDVLTATYGGSISVSGNNNTDGRGLDFYGGAIAASPSLQIDGGTVRGHNVTLIGNRSLQLSNYGAVVAAGNVRVLSGDVRFNNFGLSSLATGGAIVVAGVSGNTSSFTSSNTSLTASNGRWLIYSTSPDTVDSGLSPSFRQYNAVFGTPNAVTPSAGNGLLFSLAPTVTVSGRLDRAYDGSINAGTLLSASGFTVSGWREGDIFNGVTSGASGSFATKDIGIDKPVSFDSSVLELSSGGVPVLGYGVVNQLVGTVSRASLTITARNASKPYGTTLTFAGTEFTSSGLVGSETIGNVTLTSAGAAATASVAGGPYAIVASNATGGSFSASNYTITFANGTLTVTPAAVNAVLASIVGNPTKAYDGSTTATLSSTNYSLSGFFGSDGAIVTRTAGSYDSANAGARTVTTTLANADFTPTGSTDLRNYTLPTTASGSGTITPRTLTLTGLAANNKVYDGTRVATLSNAGTLNGLVAGQTLTLSNAGATFDTKDAGSGKTVTVAGIALGNGTGLASNYQVAASATTTADITPKTLTLASVTAANKVYDGNTSATVTLGPLNGLVGSETLATTSSGRFDTKDAGTAKTVTLNTTLADGSNGGLASNYRIAPSTTTNADITRAPLTVTANDASKPYGTTLTFAGTEFTASGLVGSETIGNVTLTSAGAAATASVAGGPYAIVASNATGGSFSASNYTITYRNGSLTVTPAAVNAVLASIAGNPTKAYDGNSTATLGRTNYSLSGFFGSDGAIVTQTTGSYASANAGSRTVTATLANGDFTPTGSTDLRNYTLPTTASGSGTITPRTLTLTGLAANNKAYDGTLVAALSNAGTLNGLVAGQTLTLSNAGATFDTKDAGSGKTVTVAGIALGNGTGLASNYQVAASATTTADITPKTLTLASVTAANKVYDGNTSATVTLGPLNGLVGSETLATTSSGRFDTKDAGTAKTVTLNTTLADGSNGGLASNYRIAPSTTTNADITRAPLTVTANDASKPYGTTLTFAGTEFTASGLVGSETIGNVTLTSAGAAATASVAGGPYAIVASNATGGSFSASNYTITYRNGSLTVTPAAVNAVLASIVGNPTKAYDGNSTATLGRTNYSLSGFFGSDGAIVTQTTGSYASANAGSRTVTATLANGDFTPTGSTDLRNYTLPTTASGSGTITPRTLTLTGLAANNKAYDGTLVATLSNAGTLNGLVAGQTLTLSNTGASFDTKDASTGKTVTVAGIALGNGTGLASNYQVAARASTTADITPKTLTLASVTAANKVYDGNTAATVTLGALSGLVGTETLGTSASGNFDTKDAGTAKTVTVGTTLANGSDGGLADNYRIAPSTSTTADITPKTLTLTSVTAANKVYDGNITASVTLGSLSGLVGTETLGTSASGSFDTKDAGTAKTVTVGTTLANGSNGGLAGNYRIAPSTTTTADITPKSLSLASVTAANKVYDGNTTATVTLGTLTGLVGTETLGTSASGSFDTQDAGIAKTVAVGTTLSNGSNGGLASNYRLAPSTTTAADITPKTLTLSSVTAANKVYDGTTQATVTLGSLGGVVGSETLSITSTAAQFDTKDVGTGKPVTVSGLALVNGSGRASNYRIDATTASTTANVTPAALAVTANNASKTFGDTLAFTGTEFTSTALVGNETITRVSLDSPGTVATASVAGGPYAITPNGASGNFDPRNYDIRYFTGSLTVNPANLSAILVGVVGNPTKVYDGSTTALLSGANFSLSGFIGSDAATITQTSGRYDSANAGTRTVTVNLARSDYVGTGSTDLRNYALPVVASGSGSILPKALTVAGLTAANKTYDGNTTATVTGGTLSGLIGSETLLFANTGARFDNKDAGNGKTVTVGGLSLANGSGLASNYSLSNTSASTTATILPAALTVTANDATKSFGTALSFNGSEFSTSGLVDGENVGSVSLNSVGSTALASVTGGPYAVVASNAIGGSFSASNYTITYANGSLTVTPAAVNAVLASIVGNPTKAYDGSTTATLSSTNYSLSGFFGSDGAIVTRTAGSYDSANAGARTVTTTLANADFTPTGSTDLRNYTLPTTASGSGTITPRTLTLTGLAANNKVYDGTRVATLSNAGTLNGLVAGQTLTLSNAGATFDTKDAGSGKTVTVAGIALGNGTGLASNYQVAASATTTADITPKTLTLASVSAANKVYDGNTAATVTLGALSGLVGTETLGTSASGSFDTKDAGTAKTVTVGTTLANGSNGGLAGNYRLAPATASADITPATLVYAADPADKLVGAPLPSFSGQVSGFVAGETRASATSGSLVFVTPAVADSPAGSYAIDGGGLAATNYRFVQAPGNAAALTVTGLPPQEIDEGSKTALSRGLASVTPPRTMSSPTEGRVVDVVQALRDALLGQALLFRALPVGNMSMDTLSGLLNSRDRYKKALFADAIHQLELDPNLSDAPECQNIAEAEAGTCLITEKLKNEARAQRGLAVAVAAAAPPPAAPPAPASADTPPQPEAIVPAPLPPVVAAAPPPAAGMLRRRVRTASLPQIERKIALVIGVDRYLDKGIPQLDNAVRDARSIAQLLERSLGYDVVLLPDAGKGAVLRALNNLAIEVGPRDSVVIYYAGHGELVPSTGLGYWQLADSDAKRPDSWLSNADITRMIAKIGASQVALISDSCYSGSLVDERFRALGGTIDPQQLLNRKTVVVMSSGGNEPVFDEGKQGHSPFAFSLMNNLRQVSNWQVGGSIFERVRFAVARELPQRPRYGSASAAGHQAGGDYLFEQRQLDASP